MNVSPVSITIGVSAILLANSPIPASAASFSAFAGFDINSIESQSNSSSASATANGPGIGASGSSTSGIVKANAFATNAPAIWNAIGSASAAERYSIIGNTSNQALPLSFNYDFSGSLDASSEASLNRANIGKSSITLGFTSVVLSPEASVDRYRGQASIFVANGIPQYETTGLFESSGSRAGVITPKIDVGINLFAFLDDGSHVSQKLSDTFLEELGLDKEQLDEFFRGNEFSVAENQINNAINLAASSLLAGLLPSLEISNVATFDVGFDVKYQFQDTLSILVLGDSNGSITTSLNASASTIGSANGNANFSNSLILRSITVPEDFSLNGLEGLQVAFDSGLVMPVTKRNPTIIPNPEPIPTPALLPGLIGMGIAALRKRSQDDSVEA